MIDLDRVLKQEFELSVGDMLVTNPGVEGDGPNAPYARSVFIITNYFPDRNLVQAVNITRPNREFASEIEHRMIDAGIDGEAFSPDKVFKGGPKAGSLTVIGGREYETLLQEDVDELQNIYALELDVEEMAAVFGHIDRTFAADGLYEVDKDRLHHQIACNFWKILEYSNDVVFNIPPEQRYEVAADRAGWDLSGGMA